MPQLTKGERKFLGRWVLANVISWALGIIIAIILSHTVVNLFYGRETNLIAGLCLGGAAGYAQWIVFKKYFKISTWWIFSGVIGIGLPFIAEVILLETGYGEMGFFGIEIIDQAIALLGGGLITGLLQFKILQPITNKYRYWIIVCPVSWGVGWIGIIFSGLLFGIISGIFLIRLIDFSIHEDF